MHNRWHFLIEKYFLALIKESLTFGELIVEWLKWTISLIEIAEKVEYRIFKGRLANAIVKNFEVKK